MLAKQIIAYAKLVCWVLEIPFDHPRYRKFACQLARAYLTQPEPRHTRRLQQLAPETRSDHAKQLALQSTDEEGRRKIQLDVNQELINAK